MKIVMIDIDENEYTPLYITQLELTNTAGVACLSLSIKFKDSTVLPEIVSVKAYNGKETVFNGFCDCQKITADDGFENYIYARSSACLLVDNQALPFTFNCPSTKQLFVQYARDKGSEYALPEISSTQKYEVSSGTSCFGAINDFVSLLTKSDMYISNDNKLCLAKISEDIKNLDSSAAISAYAQINRSEPICVINSKKSQGSDYILHTVCETAQKKKISRQKYLNLTSLPQWQRENTVRSRIKSSFDDYMILCVTVAGEFNEKLFQRFNLSLPVGDYEDYILTGIKYSFDKSGERTRLTLRKNIETGDVTYVD
ncbi:MAG: hypothetical protein LUG95_07475 [Clostridiales bacterium]|nr:hypothetical protein [Clostridiales bacterium]